MGVEALHTGIEFEMLAFLGASESHQPIKKLTAEASGSIFCAGDEIVDIKKSPREKRLRKPVAGNRAYFTFCLQVNNAITIFLLALHALDELVRRGEMRTQLVHYWITARDLPALFASAIAGLAALGISAPVMIFRVMPNGFPAGRRTKDRASRAIAPSACRQMRSKRCTKESDARNKFAVCGRR